MEFNNFKHPFCFLIYRNVNNEIENFYGYICLKSIRKYYPNTHVYFIDDCSSHSTIDYLDEYSSIIYSNLNEKYGSNICWNYFYYNKLAFIGCCIPDSTRINNNLPTFTNKNIILNEKLNYGIFVHESSKQFINKSNYEERKITNHYETMYLLIKDNEDTIILL